MFCSVSTRGKLDLHIPAVMSLTIKCIAKLCDYLLPITYYQLPINCCLIGKCLVGSITSHWKVNVQGIWSNSSTFWPIPIILYEQQVPKYCSYVKNGYMIPEMSYYSIMPDNVGLDLYSDSNLTVWETQRIFIRHWLSIDKADNGCNHDHAWYNMHLLLSLR